MRTSLPAREQHMLQNLSVMLIVQDCSKKQRDAGQHALCKIGPYDQLAVVAGAREDVMSADQ